MTQQDQFPRNPPTFKSALITGGSQGLGLALGKQLAKTGTQVILVARRRDPLEHAVNHIKASGGNAHFIVADISNKKHIHSIAGQAQNIAQAHSASIDLLIHAASTLGPTPLRPLLDTECEDFEQVLQTNLLGPFRLSKLILPSMLMRGHGTILNISSDAAVEAYENWGAYGVSKAALEHLSRIWSAETSGVRILSVDPGEMDTQMHADAIPDADRSQLTKPEEAAFNILQQLKQPEPLL